MRDKERKASLAAWRALHHRVRGLGRNPCLAEAAPRVLARDMAKVAKLVRAHIKTLEDMT